MKPTKPIWEIYKESAPDDILHSCASRSACLRWLKDNNKLRAYKSGVIRIGKLIWLKD